MTRDWWKHLVLILGAIVVLAPFYMMVSYSFKSPGEIDRGEGGFFGRQEMMVDERCVKLRDPNRDEVAAAADRFPGLSDNDIRATFFILGWVAKRHPHLVQAIDDAGHEVTYTETDKILELIGNFTKQFG